MMTDEFLSNTHPQTHTHTHTWAFWRTLSWKAVVAWRGAADSPLPMARCCFCIAKNRLCITWRNREVVYEDHYERKEICANPILTGPYLRRWWLAAVRIGPHPRSGHFSVRHPLLPHGNTTIIVIIIVGWAGDGCRVCFIVSWWGRTFLTLEIRKTKLWT